jgi:hypothetical protein
MGPRRRLPGARGDEGGSHDHKRDTRATAQKIHSREQGDFPLPGETKDAAVFKQPVIL